MVKHKAGLHKEVAIIFDGVWNPQIDNIHQSFGTSSPRADLYIHPKPIALKKSSKRVKNSTSAKASRRVSWNIFSPKARRERKRLSSISKHLLINFPNQNFL